ncbi:Hypothetical predicted protein, partial [Mytilus galloprovincialis]
MISCKIAALITIFIIFSFFPPTEGGPIGDCWNTWSRCSRWSSGGTGILWKGCNNR